MSIIKELNILDIFTCIINYKLDLDVSQIDSTLNDFVLNLDAVKDVYTNEFQSSNQTQILFSYTDFNFSDWDYYKFFHFYEYFEKIKELTILKDTNYETLKMTKNKEFQNLNLFSLMDKKKKYTVNQEIMFTICPRYSLYIGGEKITSYDNFFLKYYSIYKKRFHDKMLSIKDDKIIMYIPILFFENNNFPVVSLKYNQVSVEIEFSNIRDIIISNENTDETMNASIVTSKLMVDYIFLSNMERKLFTNKKLYFFIDTRETLTLPLNQSDFTIINLDFDNTSKYIFWFPFNEDTQQIITGDDIYDYEIFLDHNKICNKISSGYFKYVQPFQRLNYSDESGIMTFSFSLKPFEYQPSGICDFKSFKSKYMIINKNTATDSTKTRIYVISCGIKLCQINNGFFKIINS